MDSDKPFAESDPGAIDVSLSYPARQAMFVATFYSVTTVFEPRWWTTLTAVLSLI